MARALDVSIVVCVYNGIGRIGRTLDSLQALDSPKNAYEIIVVDDNSSDGTHEYLAEYYPDVTVVRHDKNRGVGAARNTGVQKARGRYVAFIDDDCIADAQWLSELQNTFKQQNTLAVGGVIDAESDTHINQRYLKASGYGRPAAIQTGTAKTIGQRFLAYISATFQRISNTLPTQPVVVAEVYGANSVFLRADVQAVGGFQTHLRSAEDSAICQDLQRAQPKKVIRFNPRAIVRHAFVESFAAYLSKLFYRQADTYAYYRQRNVLPPIFPFPIAIAGLTVAAGYISGWLALVALGILPLVAYSWWVLSAWQTRRLEPLVYAYMQCIEETVRCAGLVRAIFCRPRRAYPHVVTVLLSLAALWLAVHAAHVTWLALPLAFMLVYVPGYLLLEIVKLRPILSGYFKRAAFMVLLGIIWNMFIGLAATIILPLWGDNRPLETQAITSVYAASLAILGFAALLHPRAHAALRRPQAITIGSGILWLFALSLPFLAVAGANLLNRSAGNGLVVAVLVVAAILLGVTAWRAEKLPPATLPLVLFSVSLSVLLTYTMRSSYLFGWDIQQEYKVLMQTVQSAHWIIGKNHDPYDAMLSLTILPTMLSNMANLSILAIFKVLFPVFFSFVPVLLYYIYRLWADRGLAFVAAGIFVSQFYFFQEFSALARQQIAFLFFAGLLYALLHRKVRGPQRIVLGISLSAGIIMSHYSTTYMAIALFAGAYILAKLFSVSRRHSQWLPKTPRVIPLWIFVVLIGGAVLWYGPATHSTESSQKVGDSVMSSDDITSIPQNFIAGLQGKGSHTATPPEKKGARGYLQNIGPEYREERRYLSYFPDASNKDIQAVAAVVAPSRSPILIAASQLLDTALRFMWWIIGTAGILWFIVRARKRHSHYDSETAALGVMALLSFAAIHAMPTLGAYYNIARLNQQALMFVALPCVIVLAWLAQRYAASFKKIIVIAPLMAAFVIASGLLAQGVGGKQYVNLNNSGTDYQHFYIHPSEISAARWLEKDRAEKQRVIYADRYAYLRLIVPTTINGHVIADITPETLAQYAYVYANQTNIRDGVTMAEYKGEIVRVQFPEGFIASHKSTLYDNGYAKVYK